MQDEPRNSSFSDAGLPCSVDDVGRDHEVVVEELGRTVLLARMPPTLAAATITAAGRVSLIQRSTSALRLRSTLRRSAVRTSQSSAASRRSSADPDHAAMPRNPHALATEGVGLGQRSRSRCRHRAWHRAHHRWPPEYRSWGRNEWTPRARCPILSTAATAPSRRRREWSTSCEHATGYGDTEAQFVRSPHKSTNYTAPCVLTGSPSLRAQHPRRFRGTISSSTARGSSSP